MMGWAAGFFGGGSAVLVVGCLVGMGLLMWLLFRLTGDSAARVGVQRAAPGPGPEQFSEGLDGRRRARPGAAPDRRTQAPSGPAGSGSVAP